MSIAELTFLVRQPVEIALFHCKRRMYRIHLNLAFAKCQNEVTGCVKSILKLVSEVPGVVKHPVVGISGSRL